MREQKATGADRILDRRTSRFREWMVDLLVGGIAGALLGAVVAVNFVILIGVERGYEASILDVFEHGRLAGVVTSTILIAGPLVGVVIARRRRTAR